MELEGPNRLEALELFLEAVEKGLISSTIRTGEFSGLCDHGGDSSDDHPSNFACATNLHLGKWTEGRFHTERASSDTDVLAFSLNAFSKVDIATTGQVMTASLYDDQGKQLVSSSWVEVNQWQKTLAPGHYFIVLEGRPGAENEYRVRVTRR